MNTHLFRRLVFMLVALCLLGAPVLAADFYVMPDGAGRQDGADWANALGRLALVDLLENAAGPGDRILLGSGEYGYISRGDRKTLALHRGGTADRPLVLCGVDTGDGLPRIVGNYKTANVKYHAHSYAGLTIAEGVSHVRIAHLRISHYMHGIKNGGDNAHIRVDDVHIEHTREGFVLNGITDSIFRRCSIRSYAKRGMGLESGCANIQVVDVLADCTAGEADWKTEAFPFGFCVESESSNHHIRFERCVAHNNLWRGPADKYWNGDGFIAEAEAHHVSYYDCAAFDNTDGGWDNKSRASVLVRCVAAGNKRNIRIWNSHGDAENPTRLTHCLSVNPMKRGGIGGTSALWTCGPVVAEMATFAGGDDWAVELSAHDPGADFTARNCILTSTRDTAVKKPDGTTFTPIGVNDEDPQFAAPAPAWRGDPAEAYNSTRYGDAKGYHTRKHDE